MSQSLTEAQIDAVAAHERITPALVRTINDAAVAHDVDPYVLLAVGRQETDFGRGRDYDTRTGTGDGGHGHGMFQLDDRTPGRDALLRAVEHDNARAADVAATIVRDGLDHSHGDVAGAMRYYNAGSIHGHTTRAPFNGHEVPYETAIVGRVDEYRTAAHAPQEPPHATQPAAGVAPHDEWGTATFIRNEHVLRIVDAQGHAHEFAAYNTTTNPRGNPDVVGSHGPAPDGTFPLGHVDRNYADGERGGFGPVGAAPIGGTVARERGLMIHSGRGNDPSHATYGCIRTTDEAMRYLRDNPVSHLTIEENRTREQTQTHTAPRHEAVAPAHPTDQSVHGFRITSGYDAHGKPYENAAQIEAKNETLAKAVADAREGQIDDVSFKRTGRETERMVGAQNEELHRAILINLPPSMRARYEQQVGLERGAEFVGDVVNGKRVQSNVDLDAKNAKLQTDVALASHGIIDRTEMRGNGHESTQHVAFQNDTLRREILQHLPPALRSQYGSELEARGAMPTHPDARPAGTNFQQDGKVLAVDQQHGVFIMSGGRNAEWAVPIAAVSTVPSQGDQIAVNLRDGAGTLTVAGPTPTLAGRGD